MFLSILLTLHVILSTRFSQTSGRETHFWQKNYQKSFNAKMGQGMSHSIELNKVFGVRIGAKGVKKDHLLFAELSAVLSNLFPNMFVFIFLDLWVTVWFWISRYLKWFGMAVSAFFIIDLWKIGVRPIINRELETNWGLLFLRITLYKVSSNRLRPF